MNAYRVATWNDELVIFYSFLIYWVVKVHALDTPVGVSSVEDVADDADHGEDNGNNDHHDSGDESHLFTGRLNIYSVFCSVYTGRLGCGDDDRVTFLGANLWRLSRLLGCGFGCWFLGWCRLGGYCKVKRKRNVDHEIFPQQNMTFFKMDSISKRRLISLWAFIGP